MPDSPRIYVACLASYNAGTLHGEWVDATDVDEMREDIARILRTSPYPNVMIDCPRAFEHCTCAPCTECFAAHMVCESCGECGRHSEHKPGCRGCPGDNDGWRCGTCNDTGKVPSAEEWAVHDYEGFGGLASELGEYPDLEDVAMHAGMIEEHGEAWIAYVGHHGKDYAAPEDFEESYRGEWDSEEDFAEEFFGDIYDIPSHLAFYIDYEKVARDMRLGGDCSFIRNPETGRVLVFDNH